MKKISIKQIIIFIITLFILLYITYYLCNISVEKSIRVAKSIKTDDKLLALKNKQIKELSCVPRKNIDKGIIYAEAMKQYWEWKIKYLWHIDDEEIKVNCKLGYDLFGKSKDGICYPQVIMKNGTTKIYNPKTDNYLYYPEYYNKNVDFIVEMKFIASYKEDCCKLFTYEEMNKEIHNMKNIDNVNIVNLFHYNELEITDNELLSKIYFLRVIQKLGENNGNEYLSFTYYPVSKCGKVPYFDYFDL